MGCRCPVCDNVEADAVHLANHLAVLASLDRDEHREWVDEHAPDWHACTPEELASIVSEHTTDDHENAIDDHDHKTNDHENAIDDHNHELETASQSSHKRSSNVTADTAQVKPPTAHLDEHDRSANVDRSHTVQSKIAEPPVFDEYPAEQSSVVADALAEARRLTRLRHDTNQTDQSERTPPDECTESTREDE